MSIPTEPYIVRQGDFLTAIAYRHRATVQELLNDPKNEPLLKKQRVNPEILAPADVIHIPTKPRAFLPVTVGQVNAFTARCPSVTVKVILRGPDGAPLAGKAVTTEPALGGAPLATDGDGQLEIVAPVRTALLLVKVEGTPLQFHLRIGHLDPHDTETGMLSRLRQLGHLGSEDDAARTRDWIPDALLDDQASLARGLESFQRATGRDVTGEADAKLQADLRDAHGC